MNPKSCKRGFIMRKSYSKKSRTPIKRSCVRSKRLRSRRIKPLKVIPILRSGSLGKYGYAVHETERSRHIALKKALRKYGFSSVIKKLNTVRILSKNTNSIIYKRDIRYLENKYMSRSGSRRSKVKTSKIVNRSIKKSSKSSFKLGK
jgi:hypothetical protein|uniref:Uncharacterized protein n=1 Tax=viral metagenome TaxID=1070528 RepID=A0A6C0D054_9ZZZZ